MVTISDATIRSNIYETVYDLVDNISSWGLSSSNDVTVTASFIDGNGSPPLPQVVIHPININTTIVNYDRTLLDREIMVLIELFAKRKKDLDEMSDKLLSTLETASTPGMMLNGVDENESMDSPGDQKIHAKAISLTYMRRS